MIKIVLITFLYLSCIKSYGQFIPIITNTNQMILSLSKKDNTVLIGGQKNFIAKCNNNCDTLIYITSPVSTNGGSRLLIVDSITYLLLHFAGSSITIYKTIDGGINWVQKFYNPVLFDEAFHMFNNYDGILICNQGVTYRTEDCWDSWTCDNTGNNNTRKSAIFGDSFICTGVGLLSSIFYSTNQGYSWNTINGLPYQPAMYSLFLLNDSSIYSLCGASFNGNFFSYSIGNSNNFVNKKLEIDEPWQVVFTSFETGYVVGLKNTFGTIMKTTDTGSTWVDYQTPHLGALTKIVFLNDSIALIGGTDGYLAKWNKNSLALSIVKESNKTKSNISILPNPAYNKQTILIELKQEAFIEIILYTIHGQKLNSVYNKKHKAGKLIIESDVSSLTPGVYIYEITINGKTESVKFIKQ